MLGVMSLIIPLAGILALIPVTDATQPAEKDSYEVSVTADSGRRSIERLTCRPPGGTHPHKRKACRQLEAVAGDIAAIPPADGACTAEYAPVTVLAVGTWDGWPYRYEKRFDNRCVANLRTGGYVFNLT